MDFRRIDLNLMVAFQALMADRSVSAAALRLGISQPAMSNALARLRVMFDDALFVRTGRTMLPTTRAQQIDVQVTQALAQLRIALDPPSAFNPATSRRVFTVSGGDYATMVILPHLAAHLTRAAPSVDLRFRFIEKASVDDALDTGSLDLAVGVFPDPPKRFAIQPLFQERFVSLARQDHPLLSNGMLLGDFVACAHLLVTERGDDTGAVDEALEKQGLKRRVALTVPHVLVVPSILSTTDLIATVGARAARLFSKMAALTVHQTPVALPPWQMSMLWSRQKASDLGLAWLRDQLIQIAAKV
jgi:DNA-binding transcriptional LysR family regulator